MQEVKRLPSSSHKETFRSLDGIMTDYPPRLTKVINELGVGD